MLYVCGATTLEEKVIVVQGAVGPAGPAEEALAPQASPLERLLACIPLVGWFSGSIIGNQVPRNDLGDFDMARASLYWQIMFFLDLWFGLFGKELVTNDKED